MEKFRAYIGNLNRSLKGWMVLWGTAVVTILISGEVLDEANDGALRWILFGVGIYILCLATRRYLEKYTKIYVDGSGSSESLELSNVSFSDLMNSHAFDTTAYYGILMRRLLPLMLISAAMVALAWPIGLLEPVKAVGGAAACLLAPALMVLLAWRHMMWSLSHAGALKILDLMLIGITTFVGIMVVGFAHVMIVLKPIVMIEQHLLLDGIDESVPVMWGCKGGLLMMAIVIIVIALSLMVTDSVRMTSFATWIKYSKKLVTGLLISLVLVAGILLYLIVCQNVRVTEDSFTVRSGSTEKVYGLDDVSTYRVYESMDTFAMELTFSDGRKVNLFGSVSEETKGWSEKYFSNYNYAAELVQKLLDRGILGTIEDVEDLEKTVSSLDPKCQEGFDDIRKVLQLK